MGHVTSVLYTLILISELGFPLLDVYGHLYHYHDFHSFHVALHRFKSSWSGLRRLIPFR